MVKLLIGVDESPESRHAIDVAFECFGANAVYTVASVGETQPLFGIAHPGGTLASASELNRRFDVAERAAHERAQQAAESLPNDVDVEVDVVVGRPGNALCTAATELGADAIVIGSRDKTAWDRLVSASTGRYLIDHAPCPVIVVR